MDRQTNVLLTLVYDEDLFPSTLGLLVCYVILTLGSFQYSISIMLYYISIKVIWGFKGFHLINVNSCMNSSQYIWPRCFPNFPGLWFWERWSSPISLIPRRSFYVIKLVSVFELLDRSRTSLFISFDITLWNCRYIRLFIFGMITLDYDIVIFKACSEIFKIFKLFILEL